MKSQQQMSGKRKVAWVIIGVALAALVVIVIGGGRDAGTAEAKAEAAPEVVSATEESQAIVEEVAAPVAQPADPMLEKRLALLEKLGYTAEGYALTVVYKDTSTNQPHKKALQQSTSTIR